MTEQISYRSYRWRGCDEWLAEAGTGPPILIAPPLFEELNRCRALLAAMMRRLAGSGFHVVLPDLPGTGESPRDLSSVTWDDWTGAIGMLAFDMEARDRRPLLVSVRGGCLLDEQAGVAGVYRFAPVAGTALCRDLVRARQSALPAKTRADAIEAEARSVGCEFAGYAIPAAMFGALGGAQVPEHPESRSVRLDTDPASADLKLAGKPLWRQAEPGDDPALADAMADDIVHWARACAG